jgi:hypothetical protein
MLNCLILQLSLEGRDRVCGGDGDDKLIGGFGNNCLVAGAPMAKEERR